MNIVIENYQEGINLDGSILELIEKAVKTGIVHEDFTGPCRVDISLVDNGRIAELNKQYREKDGPTDVLSFPMLDMEEGEYRVDTGDADPDTDEIMLGDIVVSVPMAFEQAEEYGHSIEREMAFLVTHGLLHLLGYDHEDEKEEKRMFKRQEEILNKLDVKR